MECEFQLTKEKLPTSLLRLLSNTLILYQTTPHLPVSSLLALGATSKSFKELIYKIPHVFRYLKLSDVKSVKSEVGSIDNGGQIWRNVQLDENVTEDDFYGGPLRGIFNRLRSRNLLLDVQTLILDGLSVPSDLVMVFQ
ncbi:bfb4d94b-76d8-4567-b13b-be4655024c47 [Sclerotinia trifoliorum]|uniref:Bfb4d94b-76d8-4567-b13b-be4655024c47 n=1 Tax=Sclerotinia trifoliorum TaxID=28548 RepID=A0A8H2ZQN6_9HELO|nr:bfb4d94b-76d8-4567-b13b-be4655024c47 [Sclerotinia trifoliorum]